ncbi:GNAT family N-acetyltransferase [Hydrogenophaga sp. BPS33]|uniref:GNAT family N-acetyltransferase n=1 Tax=Hydrogenophaga sp. BPS33 TaxID=2651974 RepID=UPI00131F83A7|nr:GNAT family N-acetyltransferase [Hydrogenophaga sp. BPS33]QHE83766.1 GNAT family N-acetyltransferase [Hydrogenophaga sp. BPS33]
MRRYVCLPAETVTQAAFSLVPVQDDHIESIRIWRNEQIDVLRQATPIEKEQQVAYFQNNIWPSMEEAQPRNILLSFLENERPIGYGGLVHIAWEHQRAEVSFLVNTPLARDVPAYDARFGIFLELLKRVAFHQLGFRKLCTETYAFRDNTIRVLEASGFVLEGRLLDHVLVNGKPVTSLMHGCHADGH